MNFYNKLLQNNDLSVLSDAYIYYNNELLYAKSECILKGKIEKASSELPGLTEHRFSQWQEIQAIIRHLKILKDKLYGEKFKNYLENYQRSLSSRDIEKYINFDQEIVDMLLLINQFELISDIYNSVIKSFEIKHWQLNNLVKLKTAGFEDYSI